MEIGNKPRAGCSDRRIALELQYDGTDFEGWQIQNSGRSVQGELERALFILLKEKIRVAASGRTDSGVHALGQIIHFDTRNSIELKRICNGLNGILPRDVSVTNAYFVAPDFHARFSAVEREYRYRIYNHPQRSPFMRSRAFWVSSPLDIEYLKRVSVHLTGEMDFASFCKKESSGCNTIRKIHEITVRGDAVNIELIFRGNAFLHNMIRIIAGTLVEMNLKNSEPGSIREILAYKDRMKSGITAPPCGLYLSRVTYDPPLERMEKAFQKNLFVIDI